MSASRKSRGRSGNERGVPSLKVLAGDLAQVARTEQTDVLPRDLQEYVDDLNVPKSASGSMKVNEGFESAALHCLCRLDEHRFLRSYESSVQVFNWTTSQCIGHIRASSVVCCISAHPDQRHVVFGLKNGALAIYDATTGMPSRPKPAASGAPSSSLGPGLASGSRTGSNRAGSKSTSSSSGGGRLHRRSSSSPAARVASRGAVEEAGTTPTAARSGSGHHRRRSSSTGTGPGGSGSPGGSRGRPRRTIWHSATVRAVECIPQTSRVVSASYDKTLSLWTEDVQAMIRGFAGHSDWVRSVVAVRSEPHSFLSCSLDNTVRLWDERQPSAAYTWSIGRLPYSVADLGDGRLFLSLEGLELGVYDLRSRKRVTALRASDWINCMSAFGDGNTVVVGTDDHHIAVWDCHTGRERVKLSAQTVHGKRPIENVVGFLDSQRRRHIVSASDHTLSVWR